jgi:hypothetical protein
VTGSEFANEFGGILCGVYRERLGDDEQRIGKLGNG